MKKQRDGVTQIENPFPINIRFNPPHYLVFEDFRITTPDIDKIINWWSFCQTQNLQKLEFRHCVIKVEILSKLLNSIRKSVTTLKYASFSIISNVNYIQTIIPYLKDVIILDLFSYLSSPYIYLSDISAIFQHLNLELFNTSIDIEHEQDLHTLANFIVNSRRLKSLSINIESINFNLVVHRKLSHLLDKNARLLYLRINCGGATPVDTHRLTTRNAVGYRKCRIATLCTIWAMKQWGHCHNISKLIGEYVHATRGEYDWVKK